ncbi:MAG: nitronate monooxygenase [Chloroflexi bacterium]|nr:nitronate monooxygenase [Chloroflexota bacterium]
MLKTRITELLGIDRPIISAPMIKSSGGRLAAAVSLAGGLGTFGCVGAAKNTDPEYIREQIGYIRSQTDKPFGAGFLTQHIAAAPENFDTVLEEEVPVILFSFADPRPWLSRAKESGAKTICQVQTVEDARIAVAGGADVVAAQGNESGGHTGIMNLIPFIVRLVEEFPDVPIIAAGGISNGRSLAAVLAAGADGAWMGTAFVATEEDDERPDSHKELIVRSDGDDTIYTQVFDILFQGAYGGEWPKGLAARVFNNRLAQEWHGRENELREHLAEVLPSYLEGRERVDTDLAPTFIGESAAFISAVRPAAEVVRTVCDEAEQQLRRRSAELVS